MERRKPRRIIAGCFALCAFALALLSGLSAEAPIVVILTRGLVSLVGCYIVGLLIGIVGERCIAEHFDSLKHPHGATPAGASVAPSADGEAGPRAP